MKQHARNNCNVVKDVPVGSIIRDRTAFLTGFENFKFLLGTRRPTND